MEVKIELSGQVMTAYLSGEIDHHSIRPVREEIDRFAEGAIPKLLLPGFYRCYFYGFQWNWLSDGTVQAFKINGWRSKGD